jgi:hypothetical protein
LIRKIYANILGQLIVPESKKAVMVRWLMRKDIRNTLKGLSLAKHRQIFSASK